MPIDPRIALSIRSPDIPSSLDAYARFAQIQGMQQEQQMNALRMQAAQREEEQRNTLNQLYQQSVSGTGELDKAALLSGLAQRNLGSLIPGLQKQFLEAEKEKVGLEKTKAETQSSEFKLQQERIKHGLQTIGAAKNATDVFAALDDGVEKGYFTQKQADQQKNEVASLQTMPEFNAWRQQKLQGLMTANDQLTFVAPKPQQINLGGQIQLIDTNPNSPTYKQVLQGFETVLTPAEKQRLENEKIRLGFESRRVGIEERKAKLSEQQQAEKFSLQLPAKEIQKRESVFPQATSSLKAFDAKTDSFVKDLEQLKNHPGLNQITGLVAGRVPAVTGEGRAAQALYDKVVAKGGFQALQDLRDASKTGGALGNVSNQEGKQLTASFAAIDRKQNAEDVRAAIDRAIDDIKSSKVRMREAYEMTYGYKDLTPFQRKEEAIPTSPKSNAGGVKFLGFE